MAVQHARSRWRLGATIMEVAVTAPVAFLVLIGFMVGGLGVFRYQQVASLAREGATYASLHGPFYHKRTGQPIATTEDVRNNAILPLATGLDPEALHCSLDMNTDANTVTVTVQYDWIPEAFLPASTLSSTSVMVIEQ